MLAAWAVFARDMGFPATMTLAIEEYPAVEVSDLAAPVRVMRPRRWHVWMLVAITLLGGFLRFWKIDQPAIWGDEASTFMRICGSYQDMIDILQFNGFVPLHYEVYQWIESGMPMWGHIEQAPIKPVRYLRFPYDEESESSSAAGKVPTKPILVGDHPLIAGGVMMTPFAMRIVPALAGTAMIPAIYFLVVQLTRKEIALIAALFTATSAYMLVYSRDAKMYMHFWLFCTLSVGCLLWWLRARTRISWLSWVAASCAMCGLHAPGAVLLGVELLIFLSHDRQWWIAGLIMLAGFVAGSMVGGTTNFFGNIVDSRWIIMGLGFVVGVIAYIAQRRRDWLPAVFFLLGLAIILSGIGGYYLNFNRFKERIDAGDWRADSNLSWIDDYNDGRDGTGLIGYTTSAYLSAWEWTMPGEEHNLDPRALKLLHGSLETIGVLLLIGLIPWRRFSRQHQSTDPPAGRRLFWIAVWLMLPAYAFYCVSAQRDTQSNFISDLATSFSGHNNTGYAAYRSGWQPAFVSPNQWFSDGWNWLTTVPRVVVLILAVAAIVGFVLSGRSMRQRIVKIASLLGGLVVLYALLMGTFFLMRELNYRAFLNEETWHSLWMPRYLGFLWPALAAVVATLLWRLPTWPIRYGAIALLVALNLCQFSERVHASEPPTDLIAHDILNSQPGSLERTYLAPNLRQGIGASPGEGLVDSTAWRYYLAVYGHMPVAPYDFRGGRQRFYSQFHIVSVLAPLYIRIDLQRSPNVDRIVTWEKISPHFADANLDDPLPSQLGAGWKRTSEQMFSAYDHWTWQLYYQVRRREYVRVSR
jgi:hypothetical protein